MPAKRGVATVQCPKCNTRFSLQDDYARRLADPWIREAVAAAEARADVRAEAEVEKRLKRHDEAETHLREQLSQSQRRTKQLSRQLDTVNRNQQQAIDAATERGRREAEQKLSQLARQLNQEREAKQKLTNRVNGLERRHQQAIRRAAERGRREAERQHKVEMARKDRSHCDQLAEKDSIIARMRKHGEDLERQGRPGSPQRQGMARPQQFCDALHEQFSDDVFRIIRQGVRGADLSEEIHSGGMTCGQIVLELKDTKTVSLPRWLTKITRDQREMNGTDAVLVTEKLPDSIDGIGLRDGAWVCDFDHALSLVMLIRYFRITQSCREAAEGAQQAQRRDVLDYFASEKFTGRLIAYCRTITDMRNSVDREEHYAKSAFTSRRAHIDRQHSNIIDMLIEIEERGAEMHLPEELVPALHPTS